MTIENIVDSILRKDGMDKKVIEVQLKPTGLIPTISKETIVSIVGINKSPRPITITGYGVIMADLKSKIYIFPPNNCGDPYNSICTPLPRRLNDGESCSAYMTRKDLEKRILEAKYTFPVEIKGFIESNDGTFYSDILKLEEMKP